MSSATSNGETPHSAQSSQWSFVGRKRELTELDRGLEEAFAGRGRLFLLVGDPGIGKTRLAEELSAKARSRGAHIVWGRCWEGGGAPANWPWIQIIRSFARTVEEGMLSSQMGAGASYIAHLVPQIRGQLRRTSYGERLTANEFLFQFQFSMGAHGAHPF